MLHLVGCSDVHTPSAAGSHKFACAYDMALLPAICLYLFCHRARPFVTFELESPRSLATCTSWLREQEACSPALWLTSSATVRTRMLVGRIHCSEQVDQIVHVMKLMAEPLHLTPRPDQRPAKEERRPSCGGETFACRDCGKTFPHEIKLWRYMEDFHRQTRKLCPCAADVVLRNFDRHEASQKCKRVRGAA